MKVTLNLPKASYSESVLRKALYWLTEFCEWTLDEVDDSWQIALLTNDSEFDCCKAELNRLLNDFLLRERLDTATKHMRRKIVTAALSKLSENGSTP